MFVTPVLTSRHVFFSVEPRFCKDGTKQGINKVTNIFVDIDPKGGVTQAEVVAKLQAMSHPPTAIVDSGNGIHAYWTLTEPLAISSPADIARIEGIMSALLTRLGGDPACKDISRVLRVAGSINVKDLENPKLVRILDIDDSRRYPLSLFEQPAEDGVGITIQQPKPTISQLITDMGDGDQHNRHPNLLSLAGKMIYRGMGYEDTMTAVQAIGRGVGTAPAEAARMVDYAASHRTDFTSVTSEDFSHFSKTVDTSVTSQPLKGADEVKSTPESRALLPCWDYLSRPVPPARWIIERVIPAEGVGVFAGYGRAGKSWIHMDMGLEVIRGGCWLGRFPCIERPVIYIDKENTLRLHKDRFGRLATDKGMDLSTVRNLFFDDAGRLALDKDAGQRWLLARLKDLGPSLVLIDSFSKIFSGDENSMKEVVQMTTPLVEIATRTGSFIMIIDHLGKAPSTGNAATIIKGSVEKFNFCDTVILGESTGHHCIDLEIPKQRCTGDEELKIPIEIKDVDENKVRLVVRDSGGECSFDPDAEGVDFVRGMVERESRGTSASARWTVPLQALPTEE
jgi:hypothetical protein